MSDKDRTQMKPKLECVITTHSPSELLASITALERDGWVREGVVTAGRLMSQMMVRTDEEKGA